MRKRPEPLARIAASMTQAVDLRLRRDTPACFEHDTFPVGLEPPSRSETCTVHEIDEADGVQLIVIELLEGETLRRTDCARPSRGSRYNRKCTINEITECSLAFDIVLEICDRGRLFRGHYSPRHQAFQYRSYAAGDCQAARLRRGQARPGSELVGKTGDVLSRCCRGMWICV